MRKAARVSFAPPAILLLAILLAGALQFFLLAR